MQISVQVFLLYRYINTVSTDTVEILFIELIPVKKNWLQNASYSVYHNAVSTSLIIQ